MKKFQFVFAIFFIAYVMSLLVGCQKEDDKVFNDSSISEEVSKVSLQRLAEMNFDQSISSGLYDDIENRISSLSQEDYDQYLSYKINIGIQRMVDLKIISESEKEKEIQKEYQENKFYDTKAQQFYGMPMYKLTTKRKFEMLDKIKEEKSNKTGYNISYNRNSCPKYYYPMVVSNNGTGTYSCVGIYSATNIADIDCDWEFAYNLGNNLTYGKVKTLSTKASLIFGYGGINCRRPSAPENVAHRRFLVGADKIDLLYDGSGYSAAQLFAADVKFRGLA